MSKKITIYEAAIRVLYADNIDLERGYPLPVVKREVVDEKALFYPFLRKLINFKYNCVLADEEEAMYYLLSVFDKRKDKIMEILQDPSMTEDEKKIFLSFLKRDTSCIYFDAGEAKPVFQVTKEELKDMKKKK